MPNPWYQGTPFGVPLSLGPPGSYNPATAPQFNPLDPSFQGLMHPWPLYRPGTDQRTPFGNDAINAWNAVGPGLAGALKGPLNYFGLTSPQAPAAIPGPVAQPPVAPPPSGPSGMDIASILGGGGKGLTVEQALPPQYTPPPPADYSKARSHLDKAAPTKEDLSEDKLYYMLEGLTNSGLDRAMTGPDALLALGLGLMGGMAGERKDQRASDRAYEKDRRAYEASLGEFEGRVSEADRAYQTDMAKAKFDYEARVAEALAPKVSGQYLITSKPGEKNITSTLTPLPDPDMTSKIALAFSLGPGKTNIAAAILGGQTIPGLDPNAQAQIRANLNTAFMKILESDEYKKALTTMGMTGSNKIDPQALAMQFLDQQLMMQDPQQYAAVSNMLSQRDVMRGLIGKGLGR